MQNIAIIDRYVWAKYTFFRWRCSLALTKKLGLAFTMALLTGLMAQVKIFLPFSPVPITGQVFAVLMSGVICGGVFGSLSQVIYITLGIIGIPWFACSSQSSYLLTSPTAGYLIGFIVAPMLIGRYTDNYIGARKFLPQLKLMILGVGVIYIFGAINLALVMKLGLWETLAKGVVPFVIIDLIKAILAASASWAMLPQSSYNAETDREK
ncbi:MAG: biotin transporter BioY [Candidatus Omnitrophica bacterium]|nr:biotin transporter BioY [Candidatus Omnitrophota bacterium]